MIGFETRGPVGPDDVVGIEELTADDSCVRWGGLTRLTTEQLTDRLRKPQFLQAFIRVAESKNGLHGYSDVYQVSPKLNRLYGVATDVKVAGTLIDWTCNEAQSQGTNLQTSLSATEEGRTLFTRISDHPLYPLLAERRFVPVSTTRIMRLLAEKRLGNRTLPQSYRLLDYDETLLPSLMETYYAAWPKDYYLGEEEDDIVEIFSQAHAEDLRLVISDTNDVAGYILLDRTPELGVIDEVAVHPMHRRKGIAEALVNLAIDSLGDRTISLVLMDENPARLLYDKLGFVVHEERVDLVCATRL